MTATRRAVVDGPDLLDLQRWVSEVMTWPAGSHRWGQYAERTALGEAICRTENASACHPGLASLVDGRLRELAGEALGEEATAFKDKLNYKQPGGAGFSPHQDVLAYPGVRRVLSILVAVDECTTESGCLWMADPTSRPLPTDDRGVVVDSIAAGLHWSPAGLAPGDAVCIDGLAPHYSEANSSGRPRRVLVASYAPSSEGYGRATYYDSRRSTMARASARDGRSRISTLADFEGDQVALATSTPDACTHG